MKMKTGLLALGLFTLMGAATVSCGGSSDDGDGSTAGTTAKAGTSTAGSSSAGTSSNGGNSSAGTSTNTSGSNNPTAGTASGGTGTGGRNGGNGGRNQNNGGDNGNPGAGGDGNAPECPATEPMNGAMDCPQGLPRMGCDYGATTCSCQTRGGMRTWRCRGGGGNGGTGNGGTGNGGTGNNGGTGGLNIPQGECAANAMTGDDCTTSGQCPGQQGCFCTQNKKVFCVQ